MTQISKHKFTSQFSGKKGVHTEPVIAEKKTRNRFIQITATLQSTGNVQPVRMFAQKETSALSSLSMIKTS